MLKNGFTWTIGGEAGFGINASGLIFSKTLTRSGFFIFDYIEYPSLVRGGHNVYSIHASEREVFSQKREIDILVALNQETIDLHLKNLKPGGVVVYNSDRFKVRKKEKGVNLLPVPLETLVERVGGAKVMANNVALGASVALLGLKLKSLSSVVEDVFLRKGREVVDKNQRAAQAGYDYVREKFKNLVFSLAKPQGSQTPKLVLTGNDAISLGVVLGGCKFYAAYPMTPASSILHTLASWAEKVGMVVKHAEDEISVINMAIGASFAGARSGLATSGGGFALMEEAVSLAGITETGVVIIECQRGAPATGMPTWTEQADLHFILRSGHGDFPKIVLAPGDQEEAFWLTALAFNLADLYQTPVFVISDKYLSESHKSIESSKFEALSSKFKVNRGKLATKRKSGKEVRAYPRYKITADGISPRILPGTKGFYYQANSYEHKEDGHTTEDPQERVKQVDKRGRKIKTFVKRDLPTPTLYGSKDAEVTLVGWGSTKMPVLQAISKLQATGHRPCVNFLHLNYLWPFPKEAVAKVLRSAKKVLLLEGNSTAQLGQLIRQETGIEIKNKYLKYNGRPFYPEDILDKIESLR